jgi:thiol-disulfide isomerase/thioredoxin
MRKLLTIVLVLAVGPLFAGPAPGSFSPARYQDAKVVYLDFWASWCVPCRKSFPWLNRMQAQYADQGLRVVGINLDRDRADADLFLEHYPAQFDLIFDPQGVLAERWDLQGMPSAVLVTPGGKVLERHIGFREDREQDYERLLKDLLSEEEQ